MDFGRPLLLEEGVTSRSNIRIIPAASKKGEPKDHDDDNVVGDSLSLDDMVIQAANKAAMDLFLGPSASSCSHLEQQQHQQLVNCSLYPERILPSTSTPTSSSSSSATTTSKSTIQPGDLVVIFESFDSLNFVYVTPRAIFSNRNGHFHHNDFINKPYGCKVRSRSHGGLGFVYLLKPTCELWTRSLQHRTQIVHELDSSCVVFQLELKPNMIVCECGTGSGAMSHGILRTIAPHGMLHTYEFNRVRVQRAKEEFEKNGVQHLVTVHFRDVCGVGDGGVVDTTASAAAAAAAAAAAEGATGSNNKKNKSNNDNDDDDDDEDSTNSNVDNNNNNNNDAIEHVGFDLPPQTVDAVFLDVPEPWLAISHAAFVLKSNGRIASYSPCVEQVQRTVIELTKQGFHSMKTMEVRLREYHVDEVCLERPPSVKLIPPSSSSSMMNTTMMAKGGGDGSSGGDGGGVVDGTGTIEEEEKKKSKKRKLNDAHNKDNNGEEKRRKDDDNSRLDAVEEPIVEKINKENDRKTNNQKKEYLVARPFATMRGHTAFLTFATRGVIRLSSPSQQTAS